MRCKTCHYSLENLTGPPHRCPECGREFDPNDSATKKSEGHIELDYTKFLRRDGLKGARLGIARDFMGFDPDVDWAAEAAVLAIRRAGGTVVDVQLPKWLLDSKGELHLIAKDKVRDTLFRTRSLMPEDYGQRLTADELANVVAFLGSQSVRPPGEREPARARGNRR